MSNGKKISIIIPVYNEVLNLPPLVENLIEEINKLVNDYEIIFIDDGSSDKSDERIKEFCDQNTKIKLIKLKQHCGKTAALKGGFEKANGDYIITIDADLQNKPEDIKKIITTLDEGCDVASGWRQKRKDKLASKILPSSLTNKIISVISNHNFHDIGCGLKGFKKEVLDQIEMYGDMHRFILPVAFLKGFKTAETQIEHEKRMYGKSKYNALRIFPVIRDFLTIDYFRNYIQNILLKTLLISLIIFGVLVTFKGNTTINIIKLIFKSIFIISATLYLLIKHFCKYLKINRSYEIEYTININ